MTPSQAPKPLNECNGDVTPTKLFLGCQAIYNQQHAVSKKESADWTADHAFSHSIVGSSSQRDRGGRADVGHIRRSCISASSEGPAKNGKTLTRIKVSFDGSVTEVKTVSANPVFEKEVLEALKQWRFKPSAVEHALVVTCSFEFIEDKCEGTNAHPITSETYVSAELPTTVHIKTGLQCVETNVSQRQH